MNYYVGKDADKIALMHYGVIGMKWGIRKYQNPDGTLTEAGKKRYKTVDNFEKSQRRKQTAKKVALAVGKVAVKAALAAAGASALSALIADNGPSIRAAIDVIDNTLNWGTPIKDAINTYKDNKLGYEIGDMLIGRQNRSWW